jgi:hypothetical protein
MTGNDESEIRNGIRQHVTSSFHDSAFIIRPLERARHLDDLEDLQLIAHFDVVVALQ